jgi:hypothetical protein
MSTGTCKPDGELANLMSATLGHLEVKTWYIEGEPSREGLVDPQRPHFEATEPKSQALSPAEKEDTPYKNQVSTASIDYNNIQAPSFYFPSLPGYSCDAYSCSFQA